MQPPLEIAVRLDEALAKNAAAGEMIPVEHRSAIDAERTLHPHDRCRKSVAPQKKSDTMLFTHGPSRRDRAVLVNMARHCRMNAARGDRSNRQV